MWLYSYTFSLILFIEFHYSDSLPITGNDFNIASRDPIKSPGQGGIIGDLFDDVADYDKPGLSPIIGIHAINISYGDYIESIQCEYILANRSQVTPPRRGRPSNQFVVIILDGIEHVTMIEGSTNGSLINQLTITTLGPDYERKVYGPFGKTGTTDFKVPGYILGFHGRSGLFLSNLGVYALEEVKKSELFGPGPGGTPFDDKIDVAVPPVVGIASVRLWYGDFINGMQGEFLQLGGSKVLGEVNGGQNASLTTTITLEEGEVFNKVEMKTSEDDGAYISMITFTARKKDGTTEVFGPYGWKGEQEYSFEGNIFGFYGHGGLYIDRLGFYYTYEY